MTHPIHAAAITAWANDLSTLPVRPGHDKAPAVAWKQYQQQRASIEQVNTWFTDGAHGLGIITGTVSGRLEMLELEGRAADQVDTIRDVIDGTGLGMLWQTITSGWVEQSPSGGIHWMYRLADDGQPMPRNTKIARNSDGEVLAETRAEAGYFVAAPTPGDYHTSGNPWTLTAGGPGSIPTISMEQRDSIHAIIHAVLDETPTPEPARQLSAMWSDGQPTREGDVKPGDDYEQQTSWADILEPAGWTPLHTHAGTTYWRRPGKTEGISATTGHANDRDRLYVFTTSSEFEAETPYTKFGAYTLLNHGGDHREAARKLAADGYGHRAARIIPATTATAPSHADTDGNTALAPVTLLHPATVTSSPDQLTDTGNALTTLERHRERLIYIPDMRRWATWDGHQWVISHDDAPAMQAVLETIQAMPTDNEQLATHRKRSLNARSLSNAASILRTMPSIRHDAQDFDAHPRELNTPAGIINLSTGELTPADHKRLHSKSTAAGADGRQDAPQWCAFINWAMCGDTELAAYLQRLVGVSLLGEVREHVLPFLHGGGANGKSVFLETLQAVLGDYATEAPSNLLLTGPDRHPTELALLRGRRLVIMAELNEGARFDEAKLKQLTGGDTIAARFMRGDFFKFTPTHTLWLAANHKPRVTAGGHSLWRRLRLIPFDAKIAEHEKEDGMAERLAREEGPGILQWAVDGLIDYLENGLQEPARVTAATAAYSDEEDHLGRFVDERLHIGGGEHVVTPTRDVREAYREWCLQEGETELNATAFGRELKTRFGVTKTRSNGVKKYVGVTVLNDEKDQEKVHWSDR